MEESFNRIKYTEKGFYSFDLITLATLARIINKSKFAGIYSNNLIHNVSKIKRKKRSPRVNSSVGTKTKGSRKRGKKSKETKLILWISKSLLSTCVSTPSNVYGK